MYGSFTTLLNTAAAVAIFILAVAFGPAALLGGVETGGGETVSGFTGGAVVAQLAPGQGMVAPRD